MEKYQSKLGEPVLHDEISFREAVPADAGEVSSLLRQSFLEFEALYTTEAFAATVLARKGVLARLGEGPIWVARMQTALVGTVGAVSLRDHVMVRGMAVAPTARGQGIGAGLLAITEAFARKQGRNVLSLYTTAFLTQAIHLYEKSGFRFTGETSNPHGTELLRMVKPL